MGTRALWDSDALVAMALDVASWHAEASCADRDPDLWFPARHTCGRRRFTDPLDDDCVACFLSAPLGNNHADEAKKVCASCPSAQACLAFACLNNEDDGIWGGVGNDRRRRVRRTLVDAPQLFARVVQEELAEVRRLALGDADARPHRARHRCDRCDEWVPAGTWPPDRNGPDATCGRAVTYNRGCRCERCRWAKAVAMSPHLRKKAA